MSGVLSDERSGLSFAMYSVQYIYILHVILLYSFTNQIYHTHSLSLSPSVRSKDQFRFITLGGRDTKHLPEEFYISYLRQLFA
jgi:hypothetical protein